MLCTYLLMLCLEYDAYPPEHLHELGEVPARAARDA